MDLILGNKDKTVKTILLSIILAVVTGLLIAIFSPLYGLVLIAFLAFFAFALSELSYGIIFWIITGGVLAIPVFTFHNASIYPGFLILCLLFFLWIILSLEKGTLGIDKSELHWPLIIFIILTLLSGFRGSILYDPDVHGEHRFIIVQIYASFIIVFSVLVVFLMQRFFKVKRHIYIIYFALIGLGVLLLLIELFGLPRFRWDIMIRAHALALVYASLLFIPGLSIWKRIGSIILIILLIKFVIQQFIISGEGQWIGGWFATIIPIIYITFKKSKKWSIFIFILISVLMYSLVGSQINDLFVNAKAERDYDRFILWDTSIELWQKNPFFGLGPGNYMDYSLTYAPKGFQYTSAHSQYFAVLSELGGLGLICFLWIIAKILFLGRYLINTIKDNFLKVFVIGIMGSIYGQLVTGIFADYILPSYYNGAPDNFQVTVYFWILVGGLIAVEQIVKKNNEISNLKL